MEDLKKWVGGSNKTGSKQNVKNGVLLFINLNLYQADKPLHNFYFILPTERFNQDCHFFSFVRVVM